MNTHIYLANYIFNKLVLLFYFLLATPIRGTNIPLTLKAQWSCNGLTVAAGNGSGNKLNQLKEPWGLFVDDDQTVYVADTFNDRIVAWSSKSTNGRVVAGGTEGGNQLNQLKAPLDVIVDQSSDSLIICTGANKTVMRWPRQNGTGGEILIANIDCWGLTMDERGFLYVSDEIRNEVRRWPPGSKQSELVAGGNGRGDGLNQLNWPTYIFVDRDRSLYVSDLSNHRVMKWAEGAQQGQVVAGGRGKGNALNQLSRPEGIIVDEMGTVYVADSDNHRIMRWPKGGTQGTVVAGGNGPGLQSNQLFLPVGLSFDRQGHLYVVDNWNHRVQKFELLST